jgi:hypothetical protein
MGNIEEKWAIFAIQVAEGYLTPEFFLKCYNGHQTITSTSPFTVEIECTSEIIIPAIITIQTAAAFSDESGKFIFKSFTYMCWRKIEYKIGSKSNKYKIPDGLTGEIETEECGRGDTDSCLSVISKEWQSKSIIFYLYIDGDGID